MLNNLSAIAFLRKYSVDLSILKAYRCSNRTALIIRAGSSTKLKLYNTLIICDCKSFLPPKYDILSKDRTGNKLTYGAENPILRMLNSVSPIAIVPAGDDSVKQTILDMRFNLPRAISTGPDGEPLSAFERSEMQRYLSMGNLRRDLERLFNQKSFQKDFEDYKRMDLTKGQGFDISKSRMHDEVRYVFKRAKDAAWSEFKRNNPEYAARSEERAYRKQLLKQGAMERIDQLYSPSGRREFPR